MASEAQDTAIESIRARWGTVPGGPWQWDDQPDGVIRVRFPEPHELTIACFVFPGDMETYEGPDLRLAEAVAHAPQDIATLLAALDAAASRVSALYHEVRHPINVPQGEWEDEYIRLYLRHRYGLRAASPVGDGVAGEEGQR